jgi:hypothetical protein
MHRDKEGAGRPSLRRHGAPMTLQQWAHKFEDDD